MSCCWVKQLRQNWTFPCLPVVPVSLHHSRFVKTQPPQIHSRSPLSPCQHIIWCCWRDLISVLFINLDDLKPSQHKAVIYNTDNSTIFVPLHTGFQPLQLKVDNGSKKWEGGRRKRETRLRIWGWQKAKEETEEGIKASESVLLKNDRLMAAPTGLLEE